MSHLLLSPRNGLAFKLLFGDIRNTGSPTDFPKATVGLPLKVYLDIVLVHPYSHGEGIDYKQGILNTKPKVATGKMVDIEIQAAKQPQIRERIIFYLSRLMTTPGALSWCQNWGTWDDEPGLGRI